MSRGVDELAALTAHASEVIPLEELKAKLATGRPLRVKLGLDPTAEHVTLGWAVVLRKLRTFQDLGHTAVLIVGDYTARIGDPSERDSTRPMLSADEVDAHAERVLSQFGLILDPDRLEVRKNSEWLEGLGTAGLLELATHYTVARTLERDDFAKRFAANEPISLREFLYPLLQGYDSVAVESDVEIGGTDQHFNLMVGRDIQRAYGQEPQVVMTMPLIEGTDGVKKMSQSLGNYIGITEPPNEIFGKVMSLPDGLMEKYFWLLTDLSSDEVMSTLREPPHQAKRALGRAIVASYHGNDAAQAASDNFDRVFVDKALPDDMPEVVVSEVARDGTVSVAHLVQTAGFAKSVSEARRKIAQGGVRVDDVVVDADELPAGDLAGKVLRVGKRSFAKLV